MNRPAGRKVIWTLSAAIVLLGAVAIWALSGWNSASGDPGSRVMDQLTPTVSSLPGYGTAALPWVSQIPQSLGAPYAIRYEPFQDSCDGIAGTQGWSQVVVQAGFTWTKGLSALVSHMDPRLKKLGWSAIVQPQTSNPPSQSWIKTLSNGSRAHVSVSQGLGTHSSHWQLDAIAKPVGKAAGGC
jgi:hypothetical protein